MKLYTIGILGLLLAAPAVIAQTQAEEAKKDNQTAQKADPLAVQGSGGETWDMLKGHEKGHVTMADAPANSWLAMNFQTCDKDQDKKVTESEYTKCQNPMR